MSMNEILTNDVKTWSTFYINSLNLNNSGITGITGNSSPLVVYYTAPYNLTSTGATGSAILPVQITRIGSHVNISWNQLTFTAGVTGALNFTIPTGYIPGANAAYTIPNFIFNGSTFQFAPLTIYGSVGSNLLNFTANAAGSNFNPGSNTIYSNSVTYYVA